MQPVRPLVHPAPGLDKAQVQSPTRIGSSTKDDAEAAATEAAATSSLAGALPGWGRDRPARALAAAAAAGSGDHLAARVDR
jgi:hypothetical protein